MPLRTAEALITAPDPGSGGLQSLSVLNPPSLSDRPDDIQTEFTSLAIDEKAKNVDGELCHAQLVFKLNREYLERFSRKAKASATNLTYLAFMSLLFVFIQVSACVGNLISWPIASRVSSAAFHFFPFSAIALNVLGAVFTFASAQTLFKTAKKANTMRTAEFNVCGVVWQALNAIQLPGPGSADSDSCCNIPDDLRRLLYTMDHHSRSRAFMATLSGMGFFLVSIYTFMIITAPVVVWLPMVVVNIPPMVSLSVSLLEKLPFLSGWIAQRNQRRDFV